MFAAVFRKTFPQQVGYANLMLQVPDLSAQRRLRNAKSRGGPGEVQRFANR
jgi:hypothetical protein